MPLYRHFFFWQYICASHICKGLKVKKKSSLLKNYEKDLKVTLCVPSLFCDHVIVIT